MKNENEKPVEIGKITTGRHFPKYPMTYGKSLMSGRRSGGHYWNPPADCECRRILFDPDNGERWIDVALCKACPRHKKNDCVAAEVVATYTAMQ